MLYNDRSERWDDSLFADPKNRYRGTPFWAWNAALETRRLRRQIGCFQQMGFGGFFMHSRCGLTTPYLGDEFFAAVKTCTDEAGRRGMYANLYDEDRWPSGSAGGFVSRIPAYRRKRLVMQEADRQDDLPPAQGAEAGKPWFIAAFDVVLNPAGELVRYRRIGRGESAADRKVYFFCVPDTPGDPWYNYQTYADVLNPRAVGTFLALTHEQYKKELGRDFGNVSPMIFFDEPQIDHRDGMLPSAFAPRTASPWTATLPETFRDRFGYDLTDCLPEIFWNPATEQAPGDREAPAKAADDRKSPAKAAESRIPAPTPRVRAHYYRHLAGLFADAFCDGIGLWCRENGILCTGHGLGEPLLSSQCYASGDLMRQYREMDLPGIDLLANRLELISAKQAQSVSHQMGRQGVMCELYGVTGWDFDFRGHKYQGDWLAALGVTQRVPHLCWYSMHGDAKRDYPASIFCQSPWFREYKLVEDHFARVNTVMTRGRAEVRIGMIHPIESYWLLHGPQTETAAATDLLQDRFDRSCEWLLGSHLDFDYIDEALLPGQVRPDAPRQVGESRYDAILLPGLKTLRRTTLDFLYAFCRDGGKLIFLWNRPDYVEYLPDGGAEALPGITVCDREALEKALSPCRTVSVRDENGGEDDGWLYQLRRDGDTFWLFLAHTRPAARDDVSARSLTVSLPGCYRARLYDTQTGEIRALPAEVTEDVTRIPLRAWAQDSFLIRLEEAQTADTFVQPREKTLIGEQEVSEPVAVHREEPNVLLLDMAEYALDGEEWKPQEEILRIGGYLKARLREEDPRLTGFAEGAQPWAMPPCPADHTLTLRFTVNARQAFSGLKLAAEKPETLTLTLNGEPFSSVSDGWYVDEDIRTLPLPPLTAGENRLTVTMPFGLCTEVEPLYILGDFSVSVQGSRTALLPDGRVPVFGSIVSQGLPFYGGNLTYETEIDIPQDGEAEIEVSCFAGALVGVETDGRDTGRILYAPYRLSLGYMKAGRHTVCLTLFGNRHNTFGYLHNPGYDKPGLYKGPGCWHTTGKDWRYEYQPEPTGIQTRPVIRLKKSEP